ncbi:hypothetical protein [Providencia rettgeri]|uniref:hypothetical protein n=1 Tax=Providencia rettgeri TaxID=587 RepID=UPI0032DB6DF9
MEFKHSPAPWRCHDKRPNCSGYSIVGNDGQYIGFVGDSDELSPIDANVHLIAAAPELLEALIELTESAKEAIDGLGDLSDAIDTAKAAIAKALGQQ